MNLAPKSKGLENFQIPLGLELRPSRREKEVAGEKGGRWRDKGARSRNLEIRKEIFTPFSGLELPRQGAGFLSRVDLACVSFQTWLGTMEGLNVYTFTMSILYISILYNHATDR